MAPLVSTGAVQDKRTEQVFDRTVPNKRMFGKHLFDKQVFGWFTDEQAFGVGATAQRGRTGQWLH
jgi:hypothetical protein